MVREEFGGVTGANDEPSISAELLDALALEQIQPLPADPNFGSLSGELIFGSFLAERMLEQESLRELPSWQPPHRLPWLRNPGIFQVTEKLCTTYLDCKLSQSTACSTDTSSEISVQDIVRFLEKSDARSAIPEPQEIATNDRNLKIRTALVYKFEEVPVLALILDTPHGERVDILAPLTVRNRDCKRNLEENWDDNKIYENKPI